MNSSDARLQAAISRWLPRLDEIQGWKEWKRKVPGRTVLYDDLLPGEESGVGDFDLPPELEIQHTIIMCYYALSSSLTGLRACEYYFRRYPFANLPIQKYEHLRYTCEMYFGRFYEFRERMKKCFEAINKTRPKKQKLNVGQLVKAFDKAFDQEIRERNKVHHHVSFEDIGINNLFLLTMISQNADNEWRRRGDAVYREESRTWAKRVVNRSKMVERFLNFVAEAILDYCPFLGDLAEQAEDKQSAV